MMAQQSHPQYEFHYQRVELLKTESLGFGSYGAVCKAMCGDLPCAAKILHPALFQFTAPGNTSVMRNFEQECHLLSAIKHPHIVQYLGTYHDPESKLPVLLMELMDESLTRFLDRSHEPLPYHTEVNLCHDIALALSYLHSNGIIHRDLSSNNVLLIAGSRAKVTDFGMVKLYDVNHSKAHHTPLTLCPGTTVYMSPEALGEPPVYTDKLDSFSLGVLCIQIMTHQFPDPGDRFKIIEINDPRAPSGTVKVDVPEIERRQSHIDLIGPAHPLLPVALDCLKDRDRERPSCHELCGHMSTLKASPKYTESVQQSQVNTKPTQSANTETRKREIEQIRDLQQQLHTKDDQLHTLRAQLQEKEQENQQQRQQILGQWSLLTETNDQLQTLQQELMTKDEQLAGKDHQLQRKEETNAAHLQEIQQLTQQLHTLNHQMEEKEREEILGLQTLLTATNDQLQMLQQQLTIKDEQLEEKELENLELRTLLTIKDEQLDSNDQQLQQKEAAIAAGQQEIQQLRAREQLQSSELVIAEIQQTVQDQRRLTKSEELAAKDNQLQQKEAVTAADQQEIQQLRAREQLQSSELVIAEIQQTVQDQRRLTKSEELAAKDNQLQQKEAVTAADQQESLQLGQQLQSSEQVSAEFQQSLLEREMVQDQQRPEKLQQQQKQSRGQRREEVEASGAAATIKLRWRDGGRAPCEMCGEMAAVDGSRAYFQPEGHAVFAYTFSDKKWSELPKCPNRDFSLAMVNGLLTAIGGEKPNEQATNSLLSLTGNLCTQQFPPMWTEQFPPMPTKRWLTAVVCSSKSLVVAGGEGIKFNMLSTVEVMDTKTLQWSTASSLPHPLIQANATLCGDQVYMLGGWYQTSKKSKSVFTCSLAALLKSCQPQTLGARLRTLSLTSRSKVWHQLADTPVTFSTCASVQGKLLAVGGKDSDDIKTTAIHMYDTMTNSWEVISDMATPRESCLVAVLPHNELMVVGGGTPGGTTDSVEFATIVVCVL